MRDVPIIFSAPMVRGLVREAEKPGTGKRTTRRLAWSFHDVGDNHTKEPTPWQKVKPGDRLWVRENWRAEECVDDVKPRELSKGEPIHYEASDIWRSYGSAMIQPGKLRPGIFLPRWASRLTLIVTATKIERLREISEADAMAEGVTKHSNPVLGFYVPGVEHPNKDFPVLSRPTAREMFAALWDTINGSGTWLANPEVVALSFAVHQENIDQLVDTSDVPEAGEEFFRKARLVMPEDRRK